MTLPARNGLAIRQSTSLRNTTARDSVEPISSVECMGTIAATGSTVLVTARTIMAPPVENAALLTDARKVPSTITYNACSISPGIPSTSMQSRTFAGARGAALPVMVTACALSILFGPAMPAAAAPALDAARLAEAPVIDGRVAYDPAWAGLKPASGFRQVQPHDGHPATQRTEGYVGYTDEALYVAKREGRSQTVMDRSSFALGSRHRAA